MNGNGSSDRHSQQLAVIGMQLIDDFRAIEDAIVLMSATLPPQYVETFTECAIEEVLVDFARNSSSPQLRRFTRPSGGVCEGKCTAGCSN